MILNLSGNELGQVSERLGGVQNLSGLLET